MGQEERGKNEEQLEETSSAELSQSETVDAVEPTPQTPSDNGTTAEEVEQQDDTPVSQSQPDNAAESVDSTEDEDVSATDLSDDEDDDGAQVDAEEAEQQDDTPVSQSQPDNAAESVDSTEDEDVSATDSSDEDDDDGAQVDDTDLKYKRGQVYKGVVSNTTPTAVYVDLGDGTEGVVPGRELELMTRKLLESLVQGAEVDVYVVNPNNHKGEIILSVNHALEELDWRKAEEYAKSKEVFDALIGGYNKGGLILRFGRLRGFVPQSQLAEERARSMEGDTPEERYGPMVNEPIGIKVMEVDRSRNRLILSERAAMREVRQRRKEALIEELAVGEIRKGTVVSLENFGAFVDVGGAEGLVHLTELVWGHITHPRQVVKVGEEIDVEVISIDPEQNRIGLSRRRLLRDPWDEIAVSMRRGQLVRGQVTKLTKFGAFARLIDNPAVEGLIHISELSDERVTHPKEVVKRGDNLALRIVKIDVKNRRLGLSLKSVNSTEYLDLDWEMAIEDSVNLPDEIPEPPVEELVAEAPDDDEAVAQDIADATEVSEEPGAKPEVVVEPTPDQADSHAVVTEESNADADEKFVNDPVDEAIVEPEATETKEIEELEQPEATKTKEIEELDEIEATETKEIEEASVVEVADSQSDDNDD